MQGIIAFLSSHALLASFAAALFISIVIIELIRAKKNTYTISPLQATQLINHQDAVVLDIRTIEAFRKAHIIDAVLIPMSELQPNSKKLAKYRTKPLIIVCNTGVNSQKIAATLLKNGYNAYSLTGGMRSWTDAQMPVIKG